MSLRSRSIAILAAFAIVFALVLPSLAFALSASPDSPDLLTVDQTIGGQPTRFTFNALTGEDETVTAATFEFPKGSDLSAVQIDAVTLVGLNRHNLSAKVTTEGSTMHLEFEPAIKPNSVLRIQFNGVITPEAGGMLTVGGTYDTPAGSKPLPLLQTQQSPPALSQRISFWLDKQPWVAAWNSVPILNGFFKPQLIVTSIPLAFLGWLLSIAIIAVAYPVAIPVGLLTAFAKMSKIRAAAGGWRACTSTSSEARRCSFRSSSRSSACPLIGIRIPDIPSAMGVLAFNSVRVHGRDLPSGHPVHQQGSVRGGALARHDVLRRRWHSSSSRRPFAGSCRR